MHGLMRVARSRLLRGALGTAWRQVVIVPPDQIAALAAVANGTAYSQSLSITGGVGPYSLTISSGGLPPGISAAIVGSTLALSGTEV